MSTISADVVQTKRVGYIATKTPPPTPDPPSPPSRDPRTPRTPAEIGFEGLERAVAMIGLRSCSRIRTLGWRDEADVEVVGERPQTLWAPSTPASRTIKPRVCSW